MGNREYRNQKTEYRIKKPEDGECELEAALIETKRDIKEGKIIKESVEKHIKRIIGV